MSTDIVSTDLRMIQLRHRLDDALAAKELAERAQADAELAQSRAEERTFREESRADGNEAHLRRVLADAYIDPTLPPHAVDRIAEALHDDLDGGLPVDRLAEVARSHTEKYLEEQP